MCPLYEVCSIIWSICYVTAFLVLRSFSSSFNLSSTSHYWDKYKKKSKLHNGALQGSFIIWAQITSVLSFPAISTHLLYTPAPQIYSSIPSIPGFSMCLCLIHAIASSKNAFLLIFLYGEFLFIFQDPDQRSFTRWRLPQLSHTK